MPLKIQSVFLTRIWQEQAARVEEALKQLEAHCPEGELCRVIIGERPDEGFVHVSIIHSARTMLWNDWTIVSANAESGATYEKTFISDSVTVDDIVESVRRMLLAPVDPDAV